MWRVVARYVLRYRFFLLIALAVMTIYMAFQGRGIEMSYKYAHLLPETDSVYIQNSMFREKFGHGSEVIVIGVEDSLFFSIDSYKRWQTMCQDLKEVDAVVNVLSVTAIQKLERDTKQKKFVLKPLFPDKVSSQIQLDSLALAVQDLPFYRGKLYQDDSDVYMLALTVDKDKMSTIYREEVVANIRAVCAEYEAASGMQLHYSGLPYIRVVTAQKIKKEFGMFIGLAMFVVIAILFFFFRRVKQVILPMIVVTIGVIWVVGTMSLLGYKITLLTGMIPPLLIVIGVPNCIFLVNKYHAEYIKHGNKIMALQRTIMKIGNATLLTNITTASGFATFLITSSDILKEFGLIASINILVVFFASIIVLPASFSLMAPPKVQDTHHLKSRFFSQLIAKLVMIVLRRRSVVYISSLVLLVLGGVGISRIKSTGYMVDDIPEESIIKQDLHFFESNFDGVMPLEISIDCKRPNGIIQNSMLKRLEKFSLQVEGLDEVSEAISIVPLLKFSKQAYFNGLPKYYKLPSKREQTFILSYLSNSDSDKVGQSEVSSFIDDDRQVARLSFRVKDIGTDRMEALLDTITGMSSKTFPSKKYDVVITGGSVVFTKGIQYLVKSLFQSLGLAVLLIAFFMAIMFKSKRMVLLSMIPNLIPLVFTAALMGFTGIPIKASTILVFSIAFGISVDDTIHFLAKYRQELLFTNRNIGESVVLALRETGISMIYTSIVLFFGFGIFSLSEFGGTVALGVLVALTLIVALFANLMLLPCLLMDMQKRVTTDEFKHRDEDDETNHKSSVNSIEEERVIEFKRE